MMSMVTMVSIVNISSLISGFEKVLKDLNCYIKVYTFIRVAKKTRILKILEFKLFFK